MGKNGSRNIRRWEAGDIPVNPIAAFAIELMVEDETWSAHSWKINWHGKNIWYICYIAKQIASTGIFLFGSCYAEIARSDQSLGNLSG